MVQFDKEAMFERDYDYLMVEASGKKSIFPLDDLLIGTA